MAQQLDELVDASRLQAGTTVELRRQRIDLLALARKAVGERQQTSERHLFSVSADLSELIGTWDGVRLGRVVDNLLDNAIKYSPRGGTVEVSVRSEAGSAILSVSDRGEGIPRSEEHTSELQSHSFI